MRVAELENWKAKPTLNVSKYFLWAEFLEAIEFSKTLRIFIWK